MGKALHLAHPRGFAGLVAGFLVLLAAFVAWKGVQSQIGAERESLELQLNAQKNLEAERVARETASLKAALHVELLMYSRMVVDALSILNFECVENPEKWAFPPRLVPPLVFRALVDRVGLLGEGFQISAIATFYTNLTAIISEAEKATEYAMTYGPPDKVLLPQSNPFITTHGFLAQQFRLLAANLATALNGLSATRYGITPDIDLRNLYGRNGKPLSQDAKLQTHIDGVLSRLSE